MTPSTVLDPRLRGAIVALGNFDGVHRGHRAVVDRAVAIARAQISPVMAATFDPHPVRFFDPLAPAFLLSGLGRRKRLLRSAGVDEAVAIPFDRDLASLSPPEFVRTWLRDRLGASVIVTGEDFHFGRGRGGDVGHLRALCAEEGMCTVAVPILQSSGQAVSSTAIREALNEGDVARAAHLLGRPVELDGRVMGGSGAWIAVDSGELMRPTRGRYQAALCVDGEDAEPITLAVPRAPESPLLVRDLSNGTSRDRLRSGVEVTLRIFEGPNEARRTSESRAGRTATG